MLRNRRATADVRPDPLDTVATLLWHESPADRTRAALEQLSATLGNGARALAVVTEAKAGPHSAARVPRIDSQFGYDDELLLIEPAAGPWDAPGPRIVQDPSAELFAAAAPSYRELLRRFELHRVSSGVVAPIAGRFGSFGVLLVLRHRGPRFSLADLETCRKWGVILGEAQGLGAELWNAKSSLVQFTRAFVQSAEAQDFVQLGHGDRVAAYALAIGRALALPTEQLTHLYFAAVLHDLGRMGSPVADELQDRDHPQRGANMLAGAPLLSPAADGIRYHHERWDGAGFPERLSRHAIPFLARVVATADAFDLLSSERGRALPLHLVERELAGLAGTALDPELVRVLLGVLRQGKETAELGTTSAGYLPY